MLIQQKLGNIYTTKTSKSIDWLSLEWFETTKRILRKNTHAGQEISWRFLNENPKFTEGDILFENEKSIIVATVLPCDCLVINVKNMFEMASVCYEIGNKHLPLFFENNELLVPFEMPLFRLLLMQGYDISQENRKLLQPLKTTVSAHPTLDTVFLNKIPT